MWEMKVFLYKDFPLRHCACIFYLITISTYSGNTLYYYHHFWLLMELVLGKTEPCI